MSDGKPGYTLADLERIRAELREGWEKMIAERDVRLLDQLGPDVYFAVRGDG